MTTVRLEAEPREDATLESLPAVDLGAEAAPAAPSLDAPDLYLNREPTWLEFNRRVLH